MCFEQLGRIARFVLTRRETQRRGGAARLTVCLLVVALGLVLPGASTNRVSAVGPTVNSVEFTSSGSYVVPAFVRSVKVLLRGGSGGLGDDTSDRLMWGGYGGYGREVVASFPVQPGQRFDVWVGSSGGDGFGLVPGDAGQAGLAALAGGIGGAGSAGTVSGGAGGGGGAASGLRLEAALDWLVVAGGGGGAGGAGYGSRSESEGSGGHGGWAGERGNAGYDDAAGQAGALAVPAGAAQVGGTAALDSCAGGGGGGGGGIPAAGGGGAGGGVAGSCVVAGGGGGGAGGGSYVAASVTTVSNQVSDVLGDGLVVIEEHYEYGSATSLVLVSGAVTGQTNALSARVVADDASQPRGLVEFSAVSKDSGVRFDLGSAEVGQSGLATVYRALPAGRYRVDAVFTPADGSTIAGSRLSTDDLDGDYIVRQAAVDVVVDQMADEVFAGGRVQLGARVVPEELAGGIPTGLVKFYVDGESAGDPVPLNAGRAVGWARLPAGTHQIGATFFGDSNFLAADAPAIVWDVPKAASSTSLVLTGLPGSASEPFVFDVVVSAPAGVLLSPSGHVELFDSSANTVVAVDALDSQGRAVLPVRLAAGSHRLIARYAGNDWLSGSSSAVLPVSASGQLVTVGVEASSAPSRFGERVVFTATVRPVEVFGGPPVGGRVQFVVDSVMWGAPVDVSDGVAALAVDGLSGGDHTVSASYLGDSVYQAGVSSKLTHRVIAQSAPVTLTVSQMRDKLTGSFDVLVIAQAVTGSGHNVAGKRIEVLINGRRVRTLTTDANGSASLTVRSKLLRMGNNPLVFRYYPDSSGLLPVVAKTVALRVKQIKAASLKIKASVERGTGKAVFTIKAEPAFRGFRVFKRQVHVRVNGRVVGRVLTDAKGVAVFNVPAQALRVGTNPVIIQFDPGATRYAKPISKTWKVQAARFGWVTHIKAPK